MALEINGELIEDAVIRSEAQMLKPRCAEMFAELDPIAAEMQGREREGAVEQLREAGCGASTCIRPMNEESWIEDVEAQLRLDRLVGKIISKVAKPKPKEVVDYYRKNTERFEAPELLHAAHI